MTPETFAEKVDQLSLLVDEELARLIMVRRPIPNLHDGMAYALGFDSEDRKVRGKRLRPVLCLATAEALGVPIRRAMRFACAIEMLHNFALVHDDIEDGDTVRRGRPCTHLVHGLAHGINIGDYMLSRVFILIHEDPENDADTRHRLIEQLDRTLENLFGGQALDISARESRSYTLREYERTVAMKTGSYLAAPILGGAMIAGAGIGTLDALSDYGRALGPLFQVKDDIIDLTTGKGRGHTGNDIREGKRSYLVAAALETCAPVDRERLYDILDRPREQTTDADVAWAVDLFQRSGAMTRAEEYCASLKKQAVDSLAALPAKLRSVLEAATDHMLKRTT